MAVDETLAKRIEAALSGKKGISSKKMFGGLCFLHNGNMLCGVDNRARLMVRVGPEQYEDALAKEHAREMDFTGRPLKGMVYVEPEGFATDEALAGWIEMGLRFTGTLPAKGVKTKKDINLLGGADSA